MSAKKTKKDLGKLCKSRSIRFSEQEWEGASACAKDFYGGVNPCSVVRIALREFLKKKGYI